MGALDEGHCYVEIENGVNGDCLGLSFETEPETLAIKEAVKVLLQGLGEDVDREGIRKTPFRVAKALREGTGGYKLNVKDIVQSALFPEAGLDHAVGSAGGTGGLVLVRDLDHFSYCESCLLPFQFKCHVGYIPSGDRVLGLSKLSRVANVFAKRLQDPQRLADEICSALHEGIKPAGVAVVLQCSHIQFPNLESLLLNPNHAGWAKALVCSGLGAFESESESRTSVVWCDYLNLLQFRGIKVDEICKRGSLEHCWCQSKCISGVKVPYKIEPPNVRMVAAVGSIIRCLGDDPLRKELIGTPSRFVKWLMNFQTSTLDLKLNGYTNGRTGHTNCNGEVLQTKEKLHSEVNLSLWSMCEHHLLPFYGVVHIGYFCTDGHDPIPKSLLQSIVHFYGFKLQVQERISKQIVETISPMLGGDAIVVIEAYHSCMISRGIEKFGSNTATIAVLGRFSSDSCARTQFLQSIPNIISGGSWC